MKNGEDWRGAAAFERSHADPDTVVLVHPALVESAQLDWFSDPEKRSYLLSVQSYYPMDGRVLPMPYVLDDAARGYLEGSRDRRAGGRGPVPAGDAVPAGAVPRLAGRPPQRRRDTRSTVIGKFGMIQVIEFSRST